MVFGVFFLVVLVFFVVFEHFDKTNSHLILHVIYFWNQDD